MSEQKDNLDKIQGEITNLINTYDKTLDSYISNIEKNNKNKAKQDLTNIRKINDKLLVLVSKSKEMMNIYIINNGKKTPKMILFDAQLREVTTKLNAGEIKMKLLNKELNYISGIDKIVTRKIVSKRIKLYLMSFFILIVFGLIIRAFIISDSNVIDTIILVSAIALLIFHIFT